MCERENVCPNDCSMHGLCVDGACVCAPGYAGRSCEESLPIPAGALAVSVDSARRCPNKCWGRGVCLLGGVCDCEPGYVGEDCASVGACPQDCSRNGLCVHGSCHCSPGWSGDDCSRPLACPHDCSDHGVCVHGRCHCETGFLADDCSVAPKLVKAAEVLPATLAVLAFGALLAGMLAGAAIKAAADRRRRARLIRYIQESDAQAPFVSGELRQAMTK